MAMNKSGVKGYRAYGVYKPYRAYMTAFVFMAAMLAVASCSRRTDYSEYRNIDASGWSYGDTLVYETALADSVQRGDLAVVVRHSDAYAYSNIWLEIDTDSADSIAADTFNVELADIYGNWHGRGLGLSYQCADTVMRGIELRDSSRITVRHIMRVESLPNIEQIGIVFIPEHN